MMNNVVLMFSPTDGETPYEQGENRSVIQRFSRVAPRSIVLTKIVLISNG